MPGAAATAVDVHTHLLPEASLASLPTGMGFSSNDEGGRLVVVGTTRSLALSGPPELYDLDRLDSLQHARGVDLSIVSPWLDAVTLPVDPAAQRAWCRTLNETTAGLLSESPRARYLAALPDQDGGAAAAELEKAVAEGAVGGALVANPETGTLARGDLDALWSTAERLAVPLVIHPSTVASSESDRQNFADVLVANPFETTRAALSLIAAGVPDRFGALDIVLVHGGGFLPYQYGRVITGLGRLVGLTASSAPAADVLRWFHYDTVLHADAPLHYLLELVGPEQVMAGSDCPFPMSDYQAFDTAAQSGLDRAEIAAVTGGNAMRVFGLSEAAR